MSSADRVALVAIGEDGATAVQVGSALHAWSGFHLQEEPCDGCSTIGRARLKMLEESGLVRRKRNGVWVKT